MPYGGHTAPPNRLPLARTVEDAVVVAASAILTWQTSHSINDVLTTVIAAPMVRSGIALTLSGGRSSGIVETLGIIRKAIDALDTQARPAVAAVTSMRPVTTNAPTPSAVQPGADTPPPAA